MNDMTWQCNDKIGRKYDLKLVKKYQKPGKQGNKNEKLEGLVVKEAIEVTVLVQKLKLTRMIMTAVSTVVK